MKKCRVLIADDEKHYCEGIRLSLDAGRYEVDCAEDVREALRLFNAHRHEIVISDIRMPNGMEGLDLLKQIKEIAPETVVIMITAYGDIDMAVAAMKLGAFDFVSKPFNAEQIEVKVNKAAERLMLQQDNLYLRRQLSSEYELIGESGAMRSLKETIAQVAKTESWVLINGPNGTGKELVARSIQKNSLRADKPFVKVNCAALPETLIEAELFGSEKGSFTGSIAPKQGKFVQADGGTIFLDEIGDMPLLAQSKVLRVLESKEISPLGSGKTMQVDFRVIAATNKDLPALIRKDAFREDLYYRINKIPIQTPPLKAMREDIPLLMQHFLVKMGRPSDISQLFSSDAVACLRSYDWPGNVREFNNVIERAVILGNNRVINAHQIRNYIGIERQEKGVTFTVEKPLKEARNDFERSYIAQVINDCKGNISEAAKRLDLHRSHLHQKMKELGL